MHTLLLLAVLAQPVLTATPEVEGSPQWVQRRLMSLDWNLTGPVVRVEDRTLRVQDSDFAEAFVLVPAAHQLAVKTKASFDKGNGFMTAALVTVGVGGALMLGGSFTNIFSAQNDAPSLSAVPWVLMSVGAVTMLAGLVLELVGLEPLKDAQAKFFSAIATYNRGLLDPRPAQTVTATP